MVSYTRSRNRRSGVAFHEIAGDFIVGLVYANTLRSNLCLVRRQRREGGYP